jgi:signal transduction histidine kinase
MIAITSQALASINQRVVQQRLQAWQVLSGRNAHIIGSKLYILQAASFVLKDFAKSIDSANYSEALSLVEHCVVGISRVVNELRRFGRRRPPEWRSLDMVALINQVVGRFRTVSSGVDVVWTPRAKSLTMRGDTLQLEEALAELLDNARHHLAPAGRIRVDLWHGHTDRGGLVRITVENPGPGVPERNKKLIFEPFYTTRSEGSGLGLAIVRQAVESHRGKIWECGVEGKSARFEIELPEEPGEEAVE